MSDPIRSYQTQRRVEFADTDIGGLVHFSRFFVFMETAEHELLRSIGTEVHSVYERGTIGWPRVSAECEYKAPVSFAETLDILVEIARKGTKSMTYRFTFSCEERVIAVGRLTSVCCVLGEPGGPRAIQIPDFIADRLEEADGDD